MSNVPMGVTVLLVENHWSTGNIWNLPSFGFLFQMSKHVSDEHILGSQSFLCELSWVWLGLEQNIFASNIFIGISIIQLPCFLSSLEHIQVYLMCVCVSTKIPSPAVCKLWEQSIFFHTEALQVTFIHETLPTVSAWAFFSYFSSLCI